jgi:hypothetical protein
MLGGFMDLKIKLSEKLSRGMLILRTLFGMIYIGIPHMICMMFVGIVAGIVIFISWWAVLFTGKYPQGMFDFVTKFLAWGARFGASLSNFTDEYPKIGLNGTSAITSLTAKNPDKLSRGLLIVRLLFSAFYVGIPHGFCLTFRMIATGVVGFIAWWAILFTGKYPAGMFAFNVGTFRWVYNVMAYQLFLTDKYPKFSGKE